MYCDFKTIENFLKCKKCQRRIDEPRILHCGKTIYSLCASSIVIDSNNQYDCLVCFSKHEISKGGLLLNLSLLEMLSIEPCEVSRGD